MSSSLQALFATIDRVQSEQDLKSQVTPKIGEHFAAKRWGIFFFDQFNLADPRFQQVLEVGLSIERNPVARYLVERHAPIHEGLVVSPKAWKLICPRADHRHVLAGPIVGNGQLLGAVGCTRDQSMPAFNAQDLSDLSAVCLHLSIWTATKRGQSRSRSLDRLTARELQIAELVALGRTNAEIGTELWITENSVKQALKRMFRKLEVTSRAEMVAQLWGNQRNSA